MTRHHLSLRGVLKGSVAALALSPLLGAVAAQAQSSSTSSATVGANPGSVPLPAQTLAPVSNLGNPAGPSAEDVTVTGSRLRTNNLTSESPVVVLTSKQIEASNASTIQDVLRLLPQSGTSGTYTTTNNGGNGSQCEDLRNLGIARTLVLVNGKRFVHTPYGDGFDCVDLTTIPIALVDRIEVLTGSATTIYGADAVSGVINIVTKKNFVGSQINVNGGISASGDDRQGLISDTTGFDFMNGRGNVVLTGSYLDSGDVAQKNRDWANPVISEDDGPGALTIGSGYTPNGRIFSLNGPTSYGTDINNTLVPFKNTYLGGTDGSNVPNGRYNYGADQDLVGRFTQGNLDGAAHFDINDHITAYLDAYYTHKDTHEQLSGQPISGTVDGSQLYVIPQGNPYAEALGINEDVYQYKRTIDWGPRGYDTHADVYQFDGGFRGNIVGNWDYDASYAYGRAVNTINQTNQVNFVHLEQEAGFQQTDPVNNPNAGIYNPAVCNAGAGCVLGNPFGAGTLSRAGIDYASFTSHATSYYQLRDLNVSITNNKLVNLPYGPLGLAIGMEHRGEDGAYHPDPIIESGQSLANTESPTGGGFSVTEAFGELNIPILKNLIAAKDLSADISGRWSDYSTFGSVENWRAGLNWSPTRDIRFRADIGTSVRQPQIYEAFGGNTTGFPPGTDPCAQVSSYGSLSGIVGSNCAKAIKGFDASTFQQAGAGQVPTISGGNPNLQPESARTYTIGTVLTPRWIPDLTASVDYFHIKIENSINVLSTQYILDQCYTSANFSSPYCSQVNPRTSVGQLSTVLAPYQNLGETRTNGIDFNLNYLLRLRGGFNLQLSNALTDTIGFTEQQTKDGPFQNFKGRLITGLYGVAYPVIRDNATATISKGPFSFAWTVRYIDGMQDNDGSNDLTPENSQYYKVNEVFYHDIVATYNFKKVLLVAGIQNLFDKTPLLVVDTTTNTDPNVYDVVGRFFYAKLQVRF